MTNDVVQVIQSPATLVEVRQDAPTVVQVVQVGPQGPPGPAGTGTEFVQSTPASTWIFTHNLGRRPVVSIYLTSGEEVEADVVASATTVTITFPSAFAGTAVLI